MCVHLLASSALSSFLRHCFFPRWLAPLRDMLSQVSQRFSEYFSHMKCVGEVALHEDGVRGVCICSVFVYVHMYMYICMCAHVHACACTCACVCTCVCAHTHDSLFAFSFPPLPLSSIVE